MKLSLMFQCKTRYSLLQWMGVMTRPCEWVCPLAHSPYGWGYAPLIRPLPALLQHKYQVSLDGTVAAYRLPYLLAGDSVILKQESSYYEHFYNELQPYVHYVPIKRDLSDLLTQIQWLKDNDDKVGEGRVRYDSRCSS